VRPGGAQAQVITDRQRRHGLGVLLASSFLMFGGFFMLVPLISVHYVRDLHFAAAAVGLALGVRQLTQQGLTLFGGALADRWGAKWLICAGMILRAAGFAGLAWATTFPLLLAMCVLAAVGGSLFEAPRSAAITALTLPNERARYFSLTGVAGGVGMTAGPLLGAILIEASWPVVCFVSGFCFLIGGLLVAWLLPPVGAVADQQPAGRGIALAARDRTFVALTVLLGGYWFMWVQLAISLPLAAQRLEPLMVGPWSFAGGAAIYTVNAGLTVVLQYPLLALAERLMRPLTIMLVGVSLMGAGLGAIAATTSMAGLLACVAVFSVGAMVVQPVQQSLTAEMADPSAVGSYFGFGALALAVGGGLGNFAGGWLYDLAAAARLPALPWLTFAAVGALVAMGLVLLSAERLSAERRAQSV
jgi:DHA1 family multidrug resistance protein-like MFS transporter